MNKLLIVLGVIAVLLGALWIGQGANLIGGSSMSGQSQWLVIGVLVLVVGVALIVVGRERRRRAVRSTRRPD